ncbi:WD repeat-containing protein 97 [Rana temporaria]|uniref:WD repeat-containing protein 97 n=1 Tax=Rana temporaria TaxID=8407 RepID=UPI001AAD9183|nr:WD repeat-containing protein 97 [Rana temporaria]
MMRKEDGKPLVLTHGLHPSRHLTFPTRLKCVKYVGGQHCLVSLDCDGNICVHHEDGRLLSQRQMSLPISGLLYADGVQLYVAWNRRGLLLLDKTFTPVSEIPVKDEVLCCVYDPGKNLLLSGGAGGVSIWRFSHGGHKLVREQSPSLREQSPSLREQSPSLREQSQSLREQSMSESIKNQDKVEVLALDTESRNPHTCFAACGTSVWEFRLMDGTLVRRRKNLHFRIITSLVYSENLHLLISGSRDGSVKVWGGEGQLLAVFVGHSGPITALSLSSSTRTLISGSEDKTIRMWDLNTQEQSEEVEISGSPIGIETFGDNAEHLLCYSGSDIHIWRIQRLYEAHCLLGTNVRDMKVVGGPFPARALCVGSDGTVTVISAITGDLLSTLSLQRDEGLLGADYSIHKETVCVLMKDGHLLKANALANPMRVLSKVNVGGDQSRPLCFALYPNIMDEEAADAEWRGVVIRGEDKGPSGPDRETTNRIFLIIGSDDGSLRVSDWYSCKLLYQTTEHRPGQVTSLTCDPKNNYIISAGSDLTVKVWRFFAHAEESLSLYMSFFCAQPVGRMCSFKSQLFVAFHGTSNASYSLVQYCLRTESRKDHPPSDDHQDQITGLCSSPALNLVATCGRDGRIRVWNHQNQLIRTLCLNSTPGSLAFIGDSGDLLVGMRSHLYRIRLAKLLPKSYQVKLLCMAASSTVPDPSVPMNDGHLKSHPMNDEKRGLHIDRGGTWKNGQQEQEYIELISRDRELLLIREGKLRPHKKLKSNTRTRREAMEQYLQLVYKQRPQIMIPEDDYIALNESPPSRTAEDVPESPGESSRGFFDSALGFPFHSLPRHLQASFLSIGTIPNSALLQLLWPMEYAERRSPREIRPEKTAEKPIFRSIPKVEEEKEVIEKKVEEVIEEPEESSDIPAILQKITASMEEQTAPVSHLLTPPSTPSPPSLPTEEKRTSLPQRPLISRLPRPRPQATKPFRQTPVQLIPQDPPNMTPKAAPPSLDPDEEEEERPLETPTVVPEIPPFILQFQDTSWFSRIFSDIQGEHSEFEARLLHGAVHMELPIRTELLRSLMILYEQGNLRDLKGIYQTLMEAVTSRSGINMKEVEDLDFVWFCLHFLIQLSGGRREPILELLVTCVQTHPSHRGRFLSLFRDIGVEDPHGFIGRQVTSWDSWEGGDRETLKRTCEDWLDSWTRRLMVSPESDESGSGLWDGGW